VYSFRSFIRLNNQSLALVTQPGACTRKNLKETVLNKGRRLPSHTLLIQTVLGHNQCRKLASVEKSHSIAQPVTIHSSF